MASTVLLTPEAPLEGFKFVPTVEEVINNTSLFPQDDFRVSIQLLSSLPRELIGFIVSLMVNNYQEWKDFAVKVGTYNRYTIRYNKLAKMYIQAHGNPPNIPLMCPTKGIIVHLKPSISEPYSYVISLTAKSEYMMKFSPVNVKDLAWDSDKYTAAFPYTKPVFKRVQVHKEIVEAKKLINNNNFKGDPFGRKGASFSKIPPTKWPPIMFNALDVLSYTLKSYALQFSPQQPSSEANLPIRYDALSQGVIDIKLALIIYDRGLYGELFDEVIGYIAEISDFKLYNWIFSLVPCHLVPIKRDQAIMHMIMGPKHDNDILLGILSDPNQRKTVPVGVLLPKVLEHNNDVIFETILNHGLITIETKDQETTFNNGPYNITTTIVDFLCLHSNAAMFKIFFNVAKDFSFKTDDYHLNQLVKNPQSTEVFDYLYALGKITKDMCQNPAKLAIKNDKYDLFKLIVHKFGVTLNISFKDAMLCLKVTPATGEHFRFYLINVIQNISEKEATSLVKQLIDNARTVVNDPSMAISVSDNAPSPFNKDISLNKARVILDTYHFSSDVKNKFIDEIMSLEIATNTTTTTNTSISAFK